MKKLVLVLLLSTSLSMCCEDPDTCFSMQTIEVRNQYLLADTNAVEPDSIDGNFYGIRLTCGMQTEICMLDGMGSQLHALSCVEGKYVLTNPIVRLSIISKYALSPDYTAGAELKELFEPLYINLNCSNGIQLDSTCFSNLSAYGDSIASLETVFNHDIATEEYFALPDSIRSWVNVLALRNVPSGFQPGPQQFSLLLTYPDGHTDTIESKPVFLK